jgi:hypothetical protein
MAFPLRVDETTDEGRIEDQMPAPVTPTWETIVVFFGPTGKQPKESESSWNQVGAKAHGTGPVRAVPSKARQTLDRPFCSASTSPGHARGV